MTYVRNLESDDHDGEPHYWTIAFVAIGFTIMLSGTITLNFNDVHLYVVKSVKSPDSSC